MLEKYRHQIDEIDTKIIDLLAKRFEIVKKIWKYKKEKNIPTLQHKRWQKVLKTRKQLAKQKWINTELIENIWNLIHKEALLIENNK